MVCIKKQPYIYYVRLTFKNRHFFRYLTCLLDRGHIKHLGITEYFDGIYGSTPTAFHKADVLQRAITENQAPKDQSVIVGDTKFDLIGGKTVGIKTIAVTWGFGENETLLAENPDFIADTTQELWDILK